MLLFSIEVNVFKKIYIHLWFPYFRLERVDSVLDIKVIHVHKVTDRYMPLYATFKINITNNI